MHRPADRNVFILDSLADFDAGTVAVARRVGDIRKVEIENDFGLVDAQRKDQIGIHYSVIQINHEVGIDPVVERPVSFSDGAGFEFGANADDGTRLQTESPAVLDRVIAVVKHTVEPFVEVRNVITTVEIVIDEDFPVAVELVMTPFHPMELPESERSNLINQICAQKLIEVVAGLSVGR